MLLAMVDEHHRDRGSSDLGKVNVWSPRIVCPNMPKQSKLLKQFEHVICAQNPWYFRSYRLFDRDPCNGLNIYQNLYKTKSNWIVFYPRVWTEYDEITRNGCSCLPWPWLQHGCSKLLLCHVSIYLIPYNSFKMYQVILKYTVLSNCSVSSFMDPSKSATGTPSMIEAPSDHSNLCPPKAHLHPCHLSILSRTIYSDDNKHIWRFFLH